MNIAPRDADTPLPLTPQAYYILLALAKSDDNGYSLIKTVKDDSQGIIKLKTGTLYPLLQRLTRLGYIEALQPHAGSGPEGLVRTYRISHIGTLVLGWEADRYTAAAALYHNRVQ